MKKQKRTLIGLIICVIIIIIVILLILFSQHSKEISNEEEDNLERKDEIVSDIIVGSNSLPRTNNIKLYYTVDECLKSYFTMIKANDNKVVLSYLNEDYIKEKNINNNNIFDILKKYNNYDTYRTAEMYELSKSQVMVYYVRGRIDSKNIYFMVRLDVNNKSFDIEPITEEVYKEKISDKNKTDDSVEKAIDKKVYNAFVYKDFSDELIARTYFADYIKAMLTDPDEAYSMLDEEYKNKRFTSIDEFKTFIKNNTERFNYSYKIEKSDVSDYKNYAAYYEFLQQNGDFGSKNYSVKYDANYTRYICEDGYNNQFIFYATDPGIYTVQIDSYTIDSEEFLEEYNSANDQEKVALNIKKVIQAVNDKDYKYVYDKLDDTFKENNFKTQKLFENSINKDFFNNNIAIISNIEKSENYYIGEVTLKNNSSSKSKSKKLTIIMQLKDETDFVMSFNIK